MLPTFGNTRHSMAHLVSHYGCRRGYLPVGLWPACGHCCTPICWVYWMSCRPAEMNQIPTHRTFPDAANISNKLKMYVCKQLKRSWNVALQVAVLHIRMILRCCNTTGITCKHVSSPQMCARSWQEVSEKPRQHSNMFGVLLDMGW
jgi:hypothetical protein